MSKTNIIKRAIAAAAAVITALSLGGCKINVGTNKTPKDDYLVAKPADKSLEAGMGVTYLDFQKEYLYFLKGQGIEDDSQASVVDACAKQRETIVNYLINEQIINAKAAEWGLDTLTDEEMKQINDEFDKLVAEQVEYFGSVEAFDQYLADCRLTQDDLLMWQKSEVITEKVRQKAIADMGYTKQDAEKQFADYVESIKETYEKNVLEYENGIGSAFWVPEGSRMIKHILLSFDSDTADEIKQLRKDGDDEAANALRAEKAEELSAQVEEIMALIEGGSDFDKLIEKYGNDKAGTTNNPDGYLVVPGSQRFMAEFAEAAFVPKNVGDVTTCVTDYGVHIMLYASEAKVKEEDTQEYIDYIDEYIRSQLFSQALLEWQEEYNFVIDYASIGLTAPSEESSSSAP